MRATINLSESVFEELLKITKTKDKTLAVELAVEDFVRREQLRELASYMGKVDILGNDEIEASELIGD